MTKEEFERGWAERSGISVGELRRWGRCAAPCDCGDDLCEGWQMLTRSQVGSVNQSSDYIIWRAMTGITVN